MIYLCLKEVRPGMVIGKPVCQARNRVYLVQAGYKLTRQVIQRLIDLGVHHLWVQCPGAQDVDEKINEAVNEKREELNTVLHESLDGMRQRADGAVDCSRFEARVGELLNEVLNDPAHAPLLASMSADCGPLVSHLSNCCYLCLLIGTHLSGYVRMQRQHVPARLAEDVHQLGMGAFVHDLGKIRLPSELQDVHVLHPRAKELQYRTHTRAGCLLLGEQTSPLARYMVAHHHQRYDGQGFPNVASRSPGERPAPLSGDKIHIFARILAAVDAFEHLLGTPQNPRPTVSALWALLQPDFAGWFDPVVVAALSRLVPPFMLGSMVTLSDGRNAIVVANHGNEPCRPIVRIVEGEPGTPEARVHEAEMDLRHTPGLRVAWVDGVDVRPFFFEPPQIEEGIMAYWGLRTSGPRTVKVDTSALLPDGQEAAAPT